MRRGGDFYVLEPTADFEPVGPGQTRHITMDFELWALLKTDAPAAFHISFAGEPPRWVPARAVFDPSDPRQTKVFPGDLRPVETPATRFAQNTAPRLDLDLADRILPRTRISHSLDLRREADYLESALDDVLAGDAVHAGRHGGRGAEVLLSLDPGLDAEGYKLPPDRRRGLAARDPGPARADLVRGAGGHDLDEDAMLHLAMGSGNDLRPGDKVFGKAPHERVANLGRTPTYQGFEQATLNFVGKGSGYPGSDYEEILHDRWGAPFTPDPNWERLTPEGRRNILGIEAQLWGENGKAPEIREYQAFPKLLGVAERAWNRDTPTPAEMPEAWRVFSNTLGQATFPLLSWYQPVGLEGTGVNYRIPLPGGRIEGGVLRANVRNPGLTIEYSLDGQRWFTYRRPVRVGDSAWLRTKAPDGRTSRVARVTG